MSEAGDKRPCRPYLSHAFWALLAAIACERVTLVADPADAQLVMALFVALALAAALACAARSFRIPWATLVVVVLASASAALGACLGELSAQRALSARLGETSISSVQLVVEGDMRQGTSGWRGRAQVISDGNALGEVWLLADEPLKIGSTIRCVGRYAPNEDGEWGDASRSQGLAGTVRVVRVLETRQADGLLGSLYDLRELVLESFDAGSSDTRALLAGSVCASTVAMGERGLDESFATCGVSHLVAVSGGHLVLVCGALTAFLRRTRLCVPIRLALLLLASGSFVLFCAAPASAVRSWAMLLVAGASELAGRRAHPLTSASVVGLVMALVDPGVSGQLGFLLSVACVCGICALGPYARYVVRTLLPEGRLLFRLGSPGAALARALGGAGDALAMTLVAQLVTAPLVCATFSQLSLVAPLANVALAPVFSVLLAGGLVAAALVWAPPAQQVALWFCDAVGCVVMALVRAFEQMPLASVAVSVSEGEALVVLAAIVGLLFAWWPRLTRVRLLVAFAVPLALVGGWVVRGRFFSPACVCVLDVGQGDAILVTDGSASLLVDTGPSDSVLPALARRGVTHLDAVLVTHLHDDHTGGLAAARSVTGYETLYVAEGVAGAGEVDVGVTVEEVSYGDVLHVGRFELEVVSPTEAVDGSENDHSIELLVTYDANGQSLSALLTGDAERGPTNDALARGDIENVDLLKVGHHGSAESISAEAAAALDAEVAVASAGEGNAYGHPDPTCVETLEEAGSLVLCTKDVGDVCVEPGRDGPVVSCQRGAGL